jgi:hypothetical protein
MVTTVETNLADAGGQRPLRNQLTNRLGGRLVPTVTNLVSDALVASAHRDKRPASNVIHDLTADILQAAEDRETRTASDAPRRLANSKPPPLPHPT